MMFFSVQRRDCHCEERYLDAVSRYLTHILADLTGHHSGRGESEDLLEVDEHDTDTVDIPSLCVQILVTLCSICQASL